MKAMRFRHGIAMMSGLLQVSKSGYYKWLNRKPSKRAQEEGRLEIEIKAAHKRTRDKETRLKKAIEDIYEKVSDVLDRELMAHFPEAESGDSLASVDVFISDLVEEWVIQCVSIPRRGAMCLTISPILYCSS